MDDQQFESALQCSRAAAASAVIGKHYMHPDTMPPEGWCWLWGPDFMAHYASRYQALLGALGNVQSVDAIIYCGAEVRAMRSNACAVKFLFAQGEIQH